MQARRLPARHGVLWLLAGFRLFRANPPLLTALTLGYLACAVVVNNFPSIGPLLLPILLPMLIVIVANGCRAADQGRAVSVDVLSGGLRTQRVPLIRLGGLHLAGSLLVLGINLAIDGGDMLTELPQTTLDDTEMLTLLLRLIVIAIPVLMALWFAPLLTAWDGVPAMQSVFFSTIASFRNWRAFAAYGMSIVIIGVGIPSLMLVAAGLIDQSLVNILSALLRMLLVFVVAPALTASIYISYRDVFEAPRESNAVDE